jgi:hypothetical protein
MSWIDTAQDLYTNGSASAIFEATNLVYASGGMPPGTWFGLFNFALFAVVYIWSKNNAITATYGILTCSLFIFLEAMGKIMLPMWIIGLDYTIIVLCFGMVIYEMIGPRDR